MAKPLCPQCGYEQTEKGCETPGCLSSIWMTDEVRQRRARESAEPAERDRIHKIRDRCMFRALHQR
jgi:hypothetical protein